jgi:hypothetical protein
VAALILTIAVSLQSSPVQSVGHTVTGWTVDCERADRLALHSAVRCTCRNAVSVNCSSRTPDQPSNHSRKAKHSSRATSELRIGRAIRAMPCACRRTRLVRLGAPLTKGSRQSEKVSQVRCSAHSLCAHRHIGLAAHERCAHICTGDCSSTSVEYSAHVPL